MLRLVIPWVALLLALPGCGSGLKPLYNPIGGSTTTSASPGTSATPNLGRKMLGLRVPLRAGWNAVGFETLTITGLCAPPGVLAYTGGYHATVPSDGRLGYWVYAPSEGTLTYDGQGEADALELEAGWNLCSLAGRLPVKPATSLLLHELQADGSTMLVETLRPGRAYWVYAPSSLRVTWAR